MRSFFVFFILFGTQLYAESPEQLHFEYQELVEPYTKFECSHQKANVGIYDWDVLCEGKDFTRKYFAHVAVSFYPKTVFGVNSYEVLYWVTDATNAKKYLHSSSTIWMHNSSRENTLHVLEVSQGVENDLAALKLVYFPR